MPETWSVVAARYGMLETTRGDLYYRWQAYGEPDGPALTVFGGQSGVYLAAIARTRALRRDL